MKGWETAAAYGNCESFSFCRARPADLEIKDTPQSISIVTSEQMRELAASDINSALRLATGINVEE